MKRAHHTGNIMIHLSTFYIAIPTHGCVAIYLRWDVPEMALWFSGSPTVFRWSLFQHGHGSDHFADAIFLSGYLTGVGVYYPQRLCRTLLNILVAFSAGRRILVVRIMVGYDYILIMFICCSDLSLNLATLTEMVNKMICPKCKDTNPAQRCNNGMLRYVVFYVQNGWWITTFALEAASI